MRVVADRHIPYLEEVAASRLSDGGVEWVFVEPQAITREVLMDADALLIRTRTRCNEALLHGTRVQFIATATIGFDQIDTAYCERQGITWTNSPGCNAQGVCDYVETVLANLVPDAANKTLGIVGVGHVGRLVAEMAQRRGFKVLLCDPPRAEKEGTEGFVALDEIERRCDIITFHTPLTRDGKYPTWHLEKCELLRPDALIINAARGGVVDEEALLRAGNPCVIDCWEGEPNIRTATLEKAIFATYHIAGYTRRGKYNASQMVLSALCKHFGLPDIRIPNPPEEAPHIWDIRAISDQLKAHPEDFETLREAYPLR